jgi:hypothetical protein
VIIRANPFPNCFSLCPPQGNLERLCFFETIFMEHRFSLMNTDREAAVEAAQVRAIQSVFIGENPRPKRLFLRALCLCGLMKNNWSAPVAPA